MVGVIPEDKEYGYRVADDISLTYRYSKRNLIFYIGHDQRSTVKSRKMQRYQVAAKFSVILLPILLPRNSINTYYQQYQIYVV